MKIICVFTALFICVYIFFPAMIYGSSSFGFGEEVVIEKGKTVEDAINFGENVYVYGTVRKNAVSFGSDVYIETDGLVKVMLFRSVAMLS